MENQAFTSQSTSTTQLPVYTGQVVWFGKKALGAGIGFIKKLNADDEPDMFVHWSDINKDGFKTLNQGDIVTYSVGQNLQGRPKAINVVVVTPAQPQYISSASGQPYKGTKPLRDPKALLF